MCPCHNHGKGQQEQVLLTGAVCPCHSRRKPQGGPLPAAVAVCQAHALQEHNQHCRHRRVLTARLLAPVTVMLGCWMRC